MKVHTFFILLIVTLFPFVPLAAQHKVTPLDIDWKNYLANHDLRWDSITNDYYAGAIMGNGLLGTNLYKSGNNGYRLDIGRVDVTEGRGDLPDNVYSKTSALYDDARLPIGYFLITPSGTVNAENMRLSLYDAITTGKITTNKGEINFKTYVHSNKNYILFETTTAGDEMDYKWEWRDLKAISPRLRSKGDANTVYTENPNPEVEKRVEDDYNLSIQRLFCGKTYIVAWKEEKSHNRRRIIITVSHENTVDQAIASAKQTIDECIATDAITLEESHKAWWHNYYPVGFVSFGNSKMESFYWMQQYKFACATRQDKFIVDLQGPWATDNTPWPAIWFNLNTQLTYSWQNTANRAELTVPLWKALNDNIENLINNVHEPAWRKDAAAIGRSASYNLKRPLDPALADANQYEVGNLTWLLFYYWQYCTYNNKQDELLNKFYPLLKRSIAYYSHIRLKIDNVYHLPKTASPEYQAAEDCNYDLSVLRWGLNTLLAINEKYTLNDPLANHWTDFVNNLVAYPEDASQGYTIGKNVKLTSSHRHYSHLLMIYPLYLVNWEQPENKLVISKSVEHWMSMPAYLQGYSYTGSSAMYSSMGDGERAVAQLQTLIDNYIKPNTLYAEAGPVIETPLAAVASLHDLYLQSWGGKIRVFPAVPAAWAKVAFINLRTEGAFLISANRENGKTVFIQVESEAGGLCRLQTGMDLTNTKVRTLSGRDVTYSIIDESTGFIAFSTNVGDVIVLN